MTRHHRRSAVLTAAGLTALTIAATTGLSAAGAAEVHEDEGTLIGPLITETSAFAGDPSTPTFSAPSANGAGAEIPANRAGTLAAARAAAVRWSIPAPGAVTTVRPMSTPDLCLTASTTSITSYSPVTLESCVDGDPKQRFRAAENTGSNNPIGTGLQSTYNRGFLGLFNTDRVMRLQSQNVADRIPNLEDFTPSFGARVDSVDVLTRSAQISGTGTPGATVLIDGRNPQDVGSDGRWTARVTNLPLGTSTLALEQYEGSERTGTTDLEVTLTAAPLTFAAEFPREGDVTTPVTASGTAQAGAEVRLFDADGAQLGDTVTAGTDGAWDTTISAPDAGGVLRVTAAQFLDGVRDSANEVTRDLDYGAAVDISSPEDGAPHGGGSLAMAGDGEPGAAIEVFEVTADGPRSVGRSTEGVLPSGRWFVDTDALDRAEHVLRVVQHSKGANTTTAEVTVNPGATGRLTEVEFEGPATVTPGVSNRISGTGEPGATYRVLNPSGKQIVDETFEVDADGKWAFDRVVSKGAAKFDFVIEQTKGDQGPELSRVFSISANQGLVPIVPTTRTFDPGVNNTFEGTGPAGATMRVLNSSNTQIVPGTVTVNSEGKWSFDRVVSKGATRFLFKFEVSVAGTTYKTGLTELFANTR